MAYLLTFKVRCLGVAQECVIKAHISRLIAPPGGIIANCRFRRVSLGARVVYLMSLAQSELVSRPMKFTVYMYTLLPENCPKETWSRASRDLLNFVFVLAENKKIRFWSFSEYRSTCSQLPTTGKRKPMAGLTTINRINDWLVYVKFNYDRLRIDKALGSFWKPNNNRKNKNVRNAWEPIPGPRNVAGCTCTIVLLP